MLKPGQKWPASDNPLEKKSKTVKTGPIDILLALQIQFIDASYNFVLQNSDSTKPFVFNALSR